MAEPIKVAVTGYRGKVGSVLAGAFQSEPGLEYVGGGGLGDDPAIQKKAEKETLAGTRGGEEGNVAVHSVRLPGFVADQEVIFGLPGQTLTIVHRTTSREAYIPGVLLAIRKVTSEPRFYRGLDELLGLRLG